MGEKMQTEGEMQTVDFLTKMCYHFHHWQLTVNKLTGDYRSAIEAKLSDIQSNLSDIQSSLSDIYWPTRVQTFTMIRLNSPVYGQQSIMEIMRYIFKKSTVYILHFIPGLESALQL